MDQRHLLGERRLVHGWVRCYSDLLPPFWTLESDEPCRHGPDMGRQYCLRRVKRLLRHDTPVRGHQRRIVSYSRLPKVLERAPADFEFTMFATCDDWSNGLGAYVSHCRLTDETAERLEAELALAALAKL